MNVLFVLLGIFAWSFITAGAFELYLEMRSRLAERRIDRMTRNMRKGRS